MSKEELIEHARAIKDFCMKQCHDCKDCPFVFVEEGNVCMCSLTDIDDYPTRWDLSEVRVSEVRYEYAVFDEYGSCHQFAVSLEKAVEIKKILETFTINKGKKLIVKKRLVMSWEKVNTEETED